MRGVFVRTAQGLVPHDDAAREALQGVALQSMVAVEVTRPRNLRFHRLYWALCSAIASSIGASRENVSDVLKLRTGHFTVVQTRKERIRLPRSISFAKMNEAEFRQFFDQCCRVVCEELLPHLAPTGLRREIEEMVGLPSQKEMAGAETEARMS
jgi:hypothetical protein